MCDCGWWVILERTMMASLLAKNFLHHKNDDSSVLLLLQLGAIVSKISSSLSHHCPLYRAEMMMMMQMW
jgi:hypothetical protein